MTIFYVGLVLFFGIHLVPELPGIRAGLARALSEKGFKGLFAIVALVGFVLIVWGFAKAPHVKVYEPADWTKWPAIFLMPLALILLAGAHMKGRIKLRLRHPMMIGVGLWSVLHLLANGDRTGLMLFGCFLVYSVLSIWSANRRGTAESFEPIARKDMMAVMGGIVVYLVLLFAHPFLFGAKIF